jgi:hypothetical protein
MGRNLIDVMTDMCALGGAIIGCIRPTCLKASAVTALSWPPSRATGGSTSWRTRGCGADGRHANRDG